MNLSLSKGGLPASVKNRAWQYCQMAWRGVTSKKALSRLARCLRCCYSVWDRWPMQPTCWPGARMM
ncbi:Pilin precursor [Citrobacter freundii]|nr:Pilin precursor [Citrobacter freundii]